jgi:hypothetical protein
MRLDFADRAEAYLAEILDLSARQADNLAAAYIRARHAASCKHP